SQSELDLAYKALGVSSDCSDAELKKAYRKLMSENHPDKLMGQGVPEDMVKMANERSSEISKAYDLIREHRKG
ncbi:MAG: DnaJ domain-containing protein, partial [Pseudomonadales bacterium]